MKIYILPEFIDDLKSLDNIKTLGRVLNKLFDAKFEFKQNRDDHRYRGVEDAWIRDVSKGTTAYRSIYILKGEKIYLYRAGTKKIEENLTSPDLTSKAFELTDFKIEIGNHVIKSKDSGKLLRSPDPAELMDEILRFTHVSLKEVWIISPVVSKELFNDNNQLGRFINRALEDNTTIILITCPPQNNDIAFYDILDERKIIVLYNEKLHAKLWFFGVNLEQLSPAEIESGYISTAILGSANLTTWSLGMDDSVPDNNLLELCYRLPYDKNTEFYTYCDSLFNNSIDHSKYKQKLRWQ